MNTGLSSAPQGAKGSGSAESGLLDLVARLEAAVGPDRGLANDVLFECGWKLYEDGPPNDPALWWTSPGGDDVRDGDQPNPLASIDAALTLVPEGYNRTLSELANGHRRADIWKPDDRTLEFHSDRGATLALAIVIACLKARAANLRRTSAAQPTSDREKER